MDDETQDDLRVNKNLGTYKGALYENMVGEALLKSGYELYYYKKENSTLEEDFFFPHFCAFLLKQYLDHRKENLCCKR